ncbi:MAG: elongation factor EF-2 [Candidatus Methanofastidiosa archaeon]|nr:elongation factor EF-2 [Candidatus Methanofastidiosa archaeon]
MGRKEEMAKRVKELMADPVHIRNTGIAAHIDHGKTTLSDNLLAGAGLMSEDLAGKQLVLDFDEQEQARGITINAANVSMVHNHNGQDYLVNLIDTPGHVDFGGDVTRAMRAIDGCIIVVCAVEGKMPQTETVVRQALKEKVKPTLFINKVDRLIRELQLSPEELQNRFIKIINEVNKLIKSAAPPEFKDKWQVNVNEGSVSFGSAYYNWAINVPHMKKSGITFKDIIEHCMNDTQKELSKKSPLHEILLDMMITHLPNPLVSQQYRIPQIWKGDLESQVGKDMLACNPKGNLGMVVTKIVQDPHAGEICVGRLFSGTIKTGQEVWIVGTKTKRRVQQVGIFMGADRENLDVIPCGNIVAVTGLKEAIAGETICTGDEPITPFEAIKHYSEPVVTVAVEPKNTKDLAKLVEVLRQVSKEDPTLVAKINEDSGEYLLSGMGELHLEVIGYRIPHERGIDIKMSQPIVIYRESIEGKSEPIEGKSPNKHNKFYMQVEPLEDNIYNAIKEGIIPEGRIKGKDLGPQLRELGMESDEIKGITDVYNGNILFNMTKGVVYINEVIELVIQSVHEAIDGGPYSREPVMKLKIKLVDCKLHEDSIHRGPAQVIPAVREGLFAAMLYARPVIYEPIQKVTISAPQDYMGAITREMQSRRGQILDISQEGDTTTVVSIAPVSEMFGFAGDIRGATEGRAIWSTEYAGYQKLPTELQNQTVEAIRKRKGLKPQPPKPEDFLNM